MRRIVVRKKREQVLIPAERVVICLIVFVV